MTIFQHTLTALLRGEKTETSRIALPEPDGETMIGTEMICYPSGIKSVCRGNDMRWTPRWQVGKDYAIQPGRGIASIGRYRIVDIWKQDVRTLADHQIAAEGFLTEKGFLAVWCDMHDPVSLKQRRKFGHVWMGIEHRPANRYMAWRMKIEVLWDTVNWDAEAVQHIKFDTDRIAAIQTRDGFTA